jgi:hypothetical protein
MAGRGEESEEFPRPDAIEWRLFEEAAVKLYYDWEVRSVLAFDSLILGF